MATRNDITNIIAYMKLCFSNYNPTLEGGLTTVDVLADLLGDLPVDELQLAVKSCCLQPGRAFAPSAGEIRGAVSDMRLKASGVPSAGEAWCEVIDFIRVMGCRDKDHLWSHPIIGKVVDAIGLVNIGMSEDVMVERAHFLKLYPTYLERERETIAQHPQIAGYIVSERQKFLQDHFKTQDQTLPKDIADKFNQLTAGLAKRLEATP